MQVSVIAKGLNVYTLQSLAVSGGNYIVPTLDGQLLTVTPAGTRTVLADLLKADLGVPFGMTEQGTDLIVTVSGYLPQHYLVRVKADGAVSTIADLSEMSGAYGAPFGVVVDRDVYWVTLSQDVVEDQSQLVRVDAQGKASAIADLSRFGNPFGITMRDRSFVVAQSFGHLVQVTEQGEVSSIADLKSAGFGLPFDVAVWRDRLVATTNAGLVIQVMPDGKVSAIVNVQEQKFGIPAGIAVDGEDLVVTTNGGFLLRVSG